MRTEKAQIIENAQTDILGQQAENKGTNITKGQLADILNVYFKPTDATEIPDEISATNDLELITIDEKYKINLSQIYTGSFEIEQAKWRYNHDTQTVTNGTLTLNIGDYVNDVETTVTGFDGKWRVLGEENGKLLLVTATCWAPFEGASTKYGTSFSSLKLEGIDGWNNGVNRLKSICATYNNDKLENGRSITVDDINKVTGYNPQNTGVNDPEQSGIGTLYDSGSIAQFKNKVTYTLKAGVANSGNRVWYKGDKTQINEIESEFQTFKPIGEYNNIAEPYTLENSYYFYYPTTLSETYDNSAYIGLSVDSAAYDALFKVMGPPYFLASKYFSTANGQASWGLRYVPGNVVAGTPVWTSKDGPVESDYGVRPVVSLKSNITPSFVSKDDTTKISTYKI